ncbi:tyrosine recombinase XerS [Lactococcus nasutitermitis]|uniref:Tyrosine recombinase XerS n=1 Tax=Lactococcus nasutitermitis TaxID=1652957 RepID=A0ABV9JDS8_9LACT|nr:tyrosine recombinase XerS [Lactococcus nasutitermitis]
MNQKQLQFKAKAEKIKTQLPWFVGEYYESKLIASYSTATLYDYLLEFRRFFAWLIERKISQASCIQKISLKDLEVLPKKSVEAFLIELREVLNTESTTNHENSLHRSLAALKALYRYLTEESEDENGNPYFERNVMSRIHLRKKEETLSYRASQLSGKLFLGNETQAFLNFIDNDYEKSLTNKQAQKCFVRNKSRDLAIVALFLASGIRNAELVALDRKDLNIETMKVHVWRKEGKADSVRIAKFAKPYLENYIKIREVNEEALFLTHYQHQFLRISSASINHLVSKYSQAFKVRVTPHMLRHTLATRLYELTGSQVLVSQQLGHASTQVTDLYTHIVDSSYRDALDSL